MTAALGVLDSRRPRRESRRHMRSHVPHPPRSALVALGVLTAAVVAALVLLVPVLSRADDLGSLKSQLGAQQARQRGLAGSIGQLNHSIATLDDQIALVRSRGKSGCGEAVRVMSVRALI